MSRETPAELAKKLHLNACGVAEVVHNIVENLSEPIVHPETTKACWDFMIIYNPDDLINDFIERSEIHWEKIYKKDKSFFLENAGQIFGELPTNDVETFKILVEGGHVSDEDMEYLWEAFSGMVKVSFRYIHLTKKFPKIDLQKHLETWEYVLN